MPRSHGFHERFQSSRPIHGWPTGMTWAALRRRCAATHSASPRAKMADRDDDDVDAVGQLRLPERQPLLAGDLVDADQADREAEAERAEAAQAGGAQDRR